MSVHYLSFGDKRLIPSKVGDVKQVNTHIPSKLGYVNEDNRLLQNKLGEVCKKKLLCTFSH